MDIIISPNNFVLNAITEYASGNAPSSEHEYALFRDSIGDRDFIYDGGPVKLSVYNFYITGNYNFIVYNSLYNTLCRLTLDEKEALDDIDNLSYEKKAELYKLGIIVAEAVDEYKTYTEFAANSSMFAQRKLNLVITTTMQCNARCSYCYEKGVVYRSFDKAQKNKILKFIEQQVNDKGVRITWFGGEPLLNTSLIEEVSTALLTKNILFNAYIITNGSLLTEDLIVNKFKKWKITGMQVTIDGTKENYERIKNYQDSSEEHYNRLLEAIKLAAKHGIQIDIRLNIDMDNLNDMKELVSELDALYANDINIVIYPAFISGTDRVVPDKLRVKVIRELMDRFISPQKMGFNDKLHSELRIMPCNNADYRAFGIDVDGNLQRCEHYVGQPNEAIGNLTNGVQGDDQRNIPYVLRKECRECIWLPKCYGGCDAHFRQGDIPCMIEKYMIPAYLEYLIEFFDSVYN